MHKKLLTVGADQCNRFFSKIVINDFNAKKCASFSWVPVATKLILSEAQCTCGETFSSLMNIFNDVSVFSVLHALQKKVYSELGGIPVSENTDEGVTSFICSVWFSDFGIRSIAIVRFL